MNVNYPNHRPKLPHPSTAHSCKCCPNHHTLHQPSTKPTPTIKNSSHIANVIQTITHYPNHQPKLPQPSTAHRTLQICCPNHYTLPKPSTKATPTIISSQWQMLPQPSHFTPTINQTYPNHQKFTHCKCCPNHHTLPQPSTKSTPTINSSHTLLMLPQPSHFTPTIYQSYRKHQQLTHCKCYLNHHTLHCFVNFHLLFNICLGLGPYL